MRTADFLSRRILSHTTGKNSSARPVIRIAITGIALGVSAMILAIVVVTGFRDEIAMKATGFSGHIRIHPFDSNNSFEDQPMHPDTSLARKLSKEPGIRHVQAYAYKAGIIKTKTEIQGTVLKGIPDNFDWTFFKSKMVSGSIPSYQDSLSTQVLISSHTASKLRLKTGDSFLVFFIQDDRKVRKVNVAGIYNTGMGEEFDAIYLLCDIRLIQRINNWKNQEVGGYEIWLDDLNSLDNMMSVVYSKAGMQLTTQSVRDLYPQLFNWLELQNLNVAVIITLIILIAAITMISTLLILVLEDSRKIGILKTIGAGDRLISKVYMQVALFLLLRGLFWGNLAALGLAYFQHLTGFFALPEESYYLSAIPVNFSWTFILLVNAGTLVICTAFLLLPARVISRIDPVKVMKFE